VPPQPKVFDECCRVLKVGKEAWIYDGCPDVFKDQADRIRREYGFLVYRIGAKVAELHGFAREEYESRIRDILDQTEFKDSYHM
jgi:hypothetical protein